MNEIRDNNVDSQVVMKLSNMLYDNNVHAKSFRMASRIKIPLLRAPPPILQHLLFDLKSNDSVNYQNNIRLYNMMFAFTTLGAKFDRSINNGGGPPTIKIQGQLCHRIGSMLPMSRQFPKFAPLYIYDTEHEIENRMNEIRDNNVDSQVVMKLSNMLYDNNVHAKSFRMASER
ncbi:hypothetical protein Lal_00016696 [Lupinus albus]|nr:hypothetical protein Lal_00016696 [Lupinus albus]